LADFQSIIAEYDAKKIAVVAASADKLADALSTVSRHQLTFPVAYGLDAAQIVALTGAFWDRDKGFLHATGFILTPEGEVAAAVYSTGPLGRYDARTTLGWITARLEE